MATSGAEFERLDRQLAAERASMPYPRRAGTGAWLELEIDEILGSVLVAGAQLDRPEVQALVRNGLALGGRLLRDYDLAADYGEAMQYVRAAPLPGRRRGYLRVDEIVALHARVARRTDPRPGALRETSLPAFAGGAVPPPAWLLPQTLAAFVERAGAGPPDGVSPLRYVADAHARFARIAPFASANGRTGRCIANLLLRRCGYAPFVIRPGERPRYVAALRAADSRDPWPLAVLLARSLARSYAFLAGDQARPLSEFATGSERATLYKAAQRGRLRAFRRAGRLVTTPAWIAAYREDALPGNGRAPRAVEKTDA